MDNKDFREKISEYYRDIIDLNRQLSAIEAKKHELQLQQANTNVNSRIVQFVDKIKSIIAHQVDINNKLDLAMSQVLETSMLASNHTITAPLHAQYGLKTLIESKNKTESEVKDIRQNDKSEIEKFIIQLENWEDKKSDLDKQLLDSTLQFQRAKKLIDNIKQLKERNSEMNHSVKNEMSQSVNSDKSVNSDSDLGCQMLSPLSEISINTIARSPAQIVSPDSGIKGFAASSPK